MLFSWHMKSAMWNSVGRTSFHLLPQQIPCELEKPRLLVLIGL